MCNMQICIIHYTLFKGSSEQRTGLLAVKNREILGLQRQPSHHPSLHTSHEPSQQPSRWLGHKPTHLPRQPSSHLPGKQPIRAPDTIISKPKWRSYAHMWSSISVSLHSTGPVCHEAWMGDAAYITCHYLHALSAKVLAICASTAKKAGRNTLLAHQRCPY
jgi:hypothetical protein